MSSGDNHHHHKSSHKVFEKISNKISSLKEDIVDAVKDRSHSTTSDHRIPMSSNPSLTNNDHVTFTLQDDIPSVHVETKQTFKSYGM